jgi:hypothetical protein
MMLAPVGIIATASSTETAFMIELQPTGDQEKPTLEVGVLSPYSFDLRQGF